MTVKVNIAEDVRNIFLLIDYTKCEQQSGGTMNYTDYKNWAEEYRQQVDVLDRKLSERSGRRMFPTAEERRIFENSTRILYEMRLDCIRTLAILEKKAKQIREEETYAESVVA